MPPPLARPWAALLCLLAAPAAATTWTEVGPGGGGAFTCVAAGPTGIIIAGSDVGGAFRSSDHGLTWTNLGVLNAGLRRTYVGAIAFDPADATLCYLGSETGLYRSSDAGLTLDLRVASGFWTAIAVAPSEPAVVYGAREGAYNSLDPQVWKSADHGLTWSLAGSLPAGTRALKLAVHPFDSGKLLAVTGWEKMTGRSPKTLFLSSDGGVTWTDAHGDSLAGGMSGRPWDAAYDPDGTGTLWATSVEGDPDPPGMDWSGHTWKGSQDAPGVWTRVSDHTGAILASLPLPARITTIDVNRDGPHCAECGTFSSTDAGATWIHASDMSGWDAGWNGEIAWAYHGAVTGVCRTLGQDLFDPAAILWATPQFLWRSADGGAMFHSLFTDLQPAGGWRGRGNDDLALAAVATANGVLYAGFYDLGLWRSLDGAVTWQPLNDPEWTGDWNGKGGDCFTVLTDPDRPGVVWAGLGNGMAQQQVLRSPAGGAPGSWTAAAGLAPGFVSGLSLDPSSPASARRMLVTVDGDVYASADDGASWSPVLTGDSCYVTAIRGTTAFAGGQKGLWRSLDGGLTWTELDPASFHLGPSEYPLEDAKWNGPHDILMGSGAVLVAVYGHGRGLYRSVDGGNTWGRLAADDYARAIHRDRNGKLYLGSSSATRAGGIGNSGASGLRTSATNGATWTNLNAGLPWPFAWPVISDPALGAWILIGVPGSGVWRAPLPGPAVLGDVTREAADRGLGLYDLQGRRITGPAGPGVYFERRGRAVRRRVVLR